MCRIRFWLYNILVWRNKMFRFADVIKNGLKTAHFANLPWYCIPRVWTILSSEYKAFIFQIRCLSSSNWSCDFGNIYEYSVALQWAIGFDRSGVNRAAKWNQTRTWGKYEHRNIYGIYSDNLELPCHRNGIYHTRKGYKEQENRKTAKNSKLKFRDVMLMFYKTVCVSI